MRRLDCLCSRSRPVETRANTGNFSVDLTKPVADHVGAISASPQFLRSPRALELEKADTEISFVSGNLRIRTPSQRSQLGKSP